MRIFDLIKEGESVTLWHPILGRAEWSNNRLIGCWCLTWAKGPEQGEALVADESVLISDLWTIAE